MKNLENWKKTFINIWIGQSISLITSSIVQCAIIWYITYQTESALWLSLATLVGFIPQGILGLFIGSYIDKRNRKKIMIYSDLFIALISFIMVVYGFFTELPIWLILVCLGLRSIGTAFHSPALQASIPLIVPEKELLKYSGYSQSLQSISLIISPAVAAILYGKIFLSFIILLDVIGALIAIFTLVISNIPNPSTKEQEKISFIKETKEGFKNIVNNRIIKYLFTVSTFYILLYMPISSLFPLLTISYFGKTTFWAGIVETVFAFGMLIGGIALAKLSIFKNKRKNLILSIFIMGVSVLIAGLLTKNLFLIFLVLSLLMGFSGPITQATITTVFAEQIKPEFLGRIYSNYTSLVVIVMPIGLLLSGVFADVIGINVWFLITGILIIILSLCMMYNKNSLEKVNVNLNVE